jgi:hypothetical protein
MDVRSAILVSGATFVFLLFIVLVLSAVPVGAQESAGGVPAGTPATASTPDDSGAEPSTITVASEGCDRVEKGATVTLADRDAAQPTQVRLADGKKGIEITETGGQIRITGPANKDIYEQGKFLDPNDAAFDDTDGVTAVVTSTGITGCAQITGATQDGGGGERADDDGPDDQQYGDDRKANVIVETVPDKPLPKTGGSPLLVGGGLMLLAAAVLGSRMIGRR